MPTVQSQHEISVILERLHARKIASLQVMGVNSLKSVTPTPQAVVHETVVGSEVAERLVTLVTESYVVNFDLQRTGRLVWHGSEPPHSAAPGTSRPTVRLSFEDGSALDLTEPAKTKRISVKIAHSSS